MRYVLTLSLVALLLSPLASAQLSGVIVYRMKEPAAALVLDENGRGQTNVTVEVEARNFACASGFDLKVEVLLEAFPNWAGASALKPSRTFTIESPGPTTGSQRHSETFTMNHAWDLAAAPEDANFTYTVRPSVRPANGFPMGSSCGPAPTFVAAQPRETLLAVCLPQPNTTVCSAPVAEVAQGTASGSEILYGAAMLAIAMALLRRRTRN